ncbi:MAG: peptidase C1 [Candidatus Aminicenantes bacterium]|nr:peptidase C1 [Candidatus Aminicenantes bacterium]
MKKHVSWTLLLLGFLCAALIFVSCGEKEKIIEKPVIQLSEEDIQVLQETVYKTRTFRGRERRYLTTDFSHLEKPASLDEFTQFFHNPPVRQYWTGTCWSFAATSLLESELVRLGKPKVKLSEMYTAYWEYVEKARRFIQEKGNSYLGQGSEHNAVIARMKQYGAVRASDYSGLLGEQVEHNHGPLFKEIKDYLLFCKENEYWDEEKAISYVKEILNKHLGKPPEKILVNDQEKTPKQYLEEDLQLRLDEYVSFISTKSIPFYTKGEFAVPDNWWHSENYYNLPLEEFFAAIHKAVKNGYTVALGGDVSEPGMSGEEDLAVIPSFDLPLSLINQDSREFRYYNRTSTDDHAIHLVGYKETDTRNWYLIKDSGSGAQRGRFKGYYLYRDDYIKLKMLTFMVHRDAVQDVLEKFSEEE